jgi:hypothetical protein
MMAQAAHAEPSGSVCTRLHPGLGRGFHLGEAQGRASNDFQAMAAAGATLVRLGLPLQVEPSGATYNIHPGVMAELARQLELAQHAGIRLVLVLRPPPEPESGLWALDSLQSSLEGHWRALARQLSGVATVAAFDLVNEPHPPGLTFGLKQTRWNALASRLVRVIRAEDASRTIVVEPSPGARPVAFQTAVKLPFDNLIYSVHMYEPFEFTHQRLGDPRFTTVTDYPGPVPGSGHWNAARLSLELAPVKEFADRHGVEIYVGEFGAVRWAPGASRQRYLQDLVALFQGWRWSWTYHAWREWQGWDAEMDAGDAASGRNESQPAFAVLRDALKRCDVVRANP